VLITGALMLLVYTIVKPAADDGWGATRTLTLGAISIAILVAFVVREATARNPLIPLRIFRSRNVSGANAIQMLIVAGMFAMFFMGSLYLQKVRGYNPLEIGFAFLPTTLVMGTISLRYSERLITRFGPRRVLLPGLGLVLTGLLLFTQTPVEGSYFAYVLPALLAIGTGVALSFPSLMTLSMSSATKSDAGLASGLVNTTLQVGGALGLAVLATLAATETDRSRGAGHTTAVALNDGYHLAYLVGAALVLTAIANAVTVLRPERRREHARELGGPEPVCSEA
jgi:predicted MFS family arabinose efflux permease